MKFTNCSVYIFIIIYSLQNFDLYAFQNSSQSTQKSLETTDLNKISTASNTIEEDFEDKQKSKKFLVQTKKKRAEGFHFHRPV